MQPSTLLWQNYLLTNRNFEIDCKMKTIPIWKSPYGCYNKPRPVKGTPLPVQNGWNSVLVNSSVDIYGPIGVTKPHAGQLIRVPHMETVPFVMEEPCMYDRSDADAFCKGCKHTISSRVALVPLNRCAADGDGDCVHAQCPQLRDNEPYTSGRSCPLHNWGEES